VIKKVKTLLLKKLKDELVVISENVEVVEERFSNSELIVEYCLDKNVGKFKIDVFSKTLVNR
jgi:hypothetical protein|tara:strand:- start:126 stop:311 length:186 start_codon:yes stop_codon:yes gene_type:complete